MTIDPAIWARLHGASTHFPVALAMAAALFDGAGLLLPEGSPRRAGLHAAGHYAIVLGALGTFPAVLSGLFLARGETLGHDALLYHHLFVWPAFAGLVALGVWRAAVGGRASRRGLTLYWAGLLVVAGLMAGAGYWGGELILNP
ncbi:MAG: DUF2231 domain-containing protein [Verrucomicrobiota bacterium]